MQLPYPLKIFYVLVCCFLIYLPGQCRAVQKLIAVTEIWPPFRMNAPDTEQGFTGIDIDILDGLEAKLQVTIEIQRHPFARALEMIKKGDAHIITGVAYTEERAKFIAYVPTSYYVVTPVFYTRKGKGHLVKTYNDLYNFTVGYSLHSAYFEPFNSDEKLRKIGVSTEEQLLKMVAIGRLDLTIGTNPNLAWDIKRHGYKGELEQALYIPEKKTPIYIGLSKKNHSIEQKQKIDEYIRHIMENGVLKGILEKYQ